MSGTQGVAWGKEVGISPDGQYQFPASPGVYAFAEVGKDRAEVRYVGQSDNLRVRIYDHLHGSDNSCLQDMLDNAADVKIRAAVEHAEERRMDIEHTCYVYYRKHEHSLCNAVEPEGSFLEGMELPF